MSCNYRTFDFLRIMHLVKTWYCQSLFIRLCPMGNWRSKALWKRFCCRLSFAPSYFIHPQKIHFLILISPLLLHQVTGILTSLCAIYKLGHRATLLSTVDTVWPCLFLTETNKNFANNTLVRKLLVKLSQRFGMCYLRPKVAAWRYQRGK